MAAAALLWLLSAAGEAQTWIWSSTPSASNQWVAFRKTFVLPDTPTQALTRIAADTKYWLWVNGSLVVFEGGLKGGPNPSDIYVDEIDVASSLRPGANTFVLLVWHLGKDGFSHQSRGAGAGGLSFRSTISFPGSTVEVLSDPTWKARPHPGYQNDIAGTQPNLRLPEWNIYYDAQPALALEGWTGESYDDSGWPAADPRGALGAAPWNQLVSRPIPLFRFTAITDYASLESAPNTLIGHLPSNLQVTPFLRVDAPAGAVIGIQSDHYMDGSEANVRATYVTRGGVQEFESLGWMSGTAVRYTFPPQVQVLSIGYRESGYAAAIAGSFTSSDPFYDRLWSMASRTLYVNMRDSYMDCPTRERAQWWGDVVNETAAAFYSLDTRSHDLGRKAIRDLVRWRKPGGVLFSPVPAGNWDQELPQQMLASIASLWRFYLHTGDSSWALEAYPVLKSYMQLWSLDADGLVAHRAGDWDWQDWGTDIDVRLMDNAWYFMALTSMSNLATLTGNSADVPIWEGRLTSVRDNFDRVLWNSGAQAYRSPGFSGPSDDRGNGLAVVAGLVGFQKYPALISLLQARQNASPYIEAFVLEALYYMRAPQSALARMKMRYQPQVDGPAYTLGEYWTADIGGTDNHAWASGPAFLLPAYAGGIQPLQPGWTTYEVRPQLGGLDSLVATVPTVRGDVVANIQGTTALTLTSPPGALARVSFPVSGASNPTVKANGTTVFENGGPTSTVPGLTFVNATAEYVTFDAAPGTWAFSRVVPPSAPPPQVSSVTPASGPAAGGTSVTVRGSGFVQGATLRIGSQLATAVTVVNGTLMVGATAQSAAGLWNVTVTNPDGQTGLLVAGYRYALRVDSFTVSPAVTDHSGTATLSWSAPGASAVSISGVGNFGAAGTASAPFSATTTYTLTATAPGANSVSASATVTILPQAGVALALPAITSPTSGTVSPVAGVGFAWNGVAGSSGYDLRVFHGMTGATVFSGSLVGFASTTSLASLPDGLYLFAVRACTSAGASDANCGGFATVDFRVQLAGPSSAPSVTFPTGGAALSTSTQTLQWTTIAPNPALPSMTYEVLLQDMAAGITALQINVPHPSTSTIFTLRSSALYRLTVRGCQAACGPFSPPVTFSVALPSVPTTAPAVACSVSGGNSLSCNWNSVANADAYQIQVVQPPPAGPGGGALTVAARQVSATTVTLPVPSGAANVYVAACTGDGCGPFSTPASVSPTGPNPSAPNLGTPMAGTVVSGPGVLFTWNRVPGDSGVNTFYRLFVQDLSRQATALDVFTTSNFYSAYFKAEGARYDALVIASPGSSPVSGPAAGFNVSGTSATAPTMVSPPHQSRVAAGNVQLGWSPVPGAGLYQYYVAVLGQGSATVTGLTTGLLVQAPLLAVSGADTTYSGIVRACLSGSGCVAGSDAGWGPWSNAPGGPGVTNFTVFR